MFLKKYTLFDATLSPRLSILLWVLVLSSCVRQPPIPEDRFHKSQLLVDAGTQLLRRRELQDARKAFELASEIAPVAAAVDGQGCVALLEGRYADAERFFREAYGMDKRYDEALVHLGFSQELQGEFEEARDMYQEYLRNYPDSAVGRNNLAALEYDQGNGKIRTVEALEKAITMSDQAVIRDNLAVLNGK
jgi:tetratricopeptide (TPR) repeat protein